MPSKNLLYIMGIFLKYYETSGQECEVEARMGIWWEYCGKFKWASGWELAYTSIAWPWNNRHKSWWASAWKIGSCTYAIFGQIHSAADLGGAVLEPGTMQHRSVLESCWQMSRSHFRGKPAEIWALSLFFWWGVYPLISPYPLYSMVLNLGTM